MTLQRLSKSQDVGRVKLPRAPPAPTHTNTHTDGDKKTGERPGTSKETEVPGVKAGERPGTSTPDRVAVI